MKKFIYISAVLLFIVSCDSSVEDRREGIKGKWVVVDYKRDWSDTINMGGLDKEQTIEKFNMYKQSLAQNEGKIFTVYKDSSYTLYTRNGSESGDYYIEDNNTTIVHYKGPKKMHGASNDEIKLLTKNKLEIYFSRSKVTAVYQRVN